MAYPSVSCCMPTYGRPVEIINESVKSFLDQDYKGQKELVIYNDNDLMRFHFDHPEVRIVNVSQREPSLGAKYNASVEMARHDFILLWDDDDINLPNRVSHSISHLIDDVFLSDRYYIFYEDSGKLDFVNSFHPATLCIRKELFFQLGGYELKDKGADLKMALHSIAVMKKGGHSMADHERFYIYKWCPKARYQHSAITRNRSDEETRKFIDARIPEHVRGDFIIVPGFHKDYQAMVREFLLQKASQHPE